MIKLENVNKYFNRFKKNQIHVINNTSIEFDKTGLVSLLGASGSGKTTLLNVIGGLDKVNGGKIFIDGKRLTNRTSYAIDKIRNLNIGYIFQDYHLVQDMSVFDNVALVLKMIGIKNKEEIKNRVNYILEQVGMYRYRNRPVGMLSGGERQRVGIARAIVKNPKVIIADEPTGNLDSKNTIEIMNIIKTISKEKLVILVTHERELAYFYSSRIIELSDGMIVSDKNNNHENDLDYHIDNRIYLKDIKSHSEVKDENYNINTYIDENQKLDLQIVVKNGNIYIKSNSKDKIEIIDSNSSIELVNDNYKKISKQVYEESSFNLDKHINENNRLRYSSIINPFKMIINGFKKVFSYSIVKKILLFGFFVSGMFILYGFSNYLGVNNITDDKFVNINKNYLIVKVNKVNLKDYLDLEKKEGIKYILPSNSEINFNIKYNDFIQTSSLLDTLNGSLASIDMISNKDLILGILPSNDSEVVVDIMAIQRMHKRENIGKQAGYLSYKDYLNKNIYLNNDKSFKIVGFVDMESPSIYAAEKMILKMLTLNNQNYGNNNYYDIMTYDGKDSLVGNSTNIIDYEDKKDSFELKKGRYPINDYEVMVNIDKELLMPLNKTIDVKINDNKLKVVGYYYDKYNSDSYLVNFNTIKYNYITNNMDMVIYSTDKDKTLSDIKNLQFNIYDSYEHSKDEYTKMVKSATLATTIMAIIILTISFVEIFLMIRASFLSRIKEIGVYRAIGVKKSDIYKMFAGEILAVTTIGGLPGMMLMAYIVKGLRGIPFIQDNYLFNFGILILSIGIMYLFNFIVGLIPVYNVIKKTPAQILSRTDIDQ